MSALRVAKTRDVESTPARPRWNPIARISTFCGCGQGFQTITEGVDHSTETGHTLTVSGEIRPSEK